MLFLEYTHDPNVDVLRVIKMLLVHDLVEIDAGDTYAYNEKACLDQAERKQKAAERVFGLLPPDQTAEFRGLWEEFEVRQTPEARYAAALDRFQPLEAGMVGRGAPVVVVTRFPQWQPMP
jgi:putative hydrolase of HD superfamily